MAISQFVVICSSGHDFKSENLKYKHGLIIIGDGAWICLGATLLPHSRIGENSVVSAREIVNQEIPANNLYIRGQLHPISYH